VVGRLRVYLLVGLIVMTIQISCASENKGLFAILDEKYIENIGDLPFSPGNPDMVIQSSNDINAWIDITGYRGMIIEGNESFINDTPEHAAIVQYDASGNPPGYLDGITKDMTITKEGEYTIAHLDVKMRWHTIQCGKSSCWNVYHSNSASFQDSEISPHRYKPISELLKANITQYNNSVYENIGININYPDELAELKVSYRNSSIIHTMKNAHVETTSTGVYFANISDVDYWHVQGFNISHLGNLITLNGNLSKMDLAELKITGLNIYESISANTTTFTLSRQEFTPEAEVQNPLLLGFLSIVAVLCAGIYFSWRSLILRL
jgi:hypothetical protein